jgi:hypothetical protein
MQSLFESRAEPLDPASKFNPHHNDKEGSLLKNVSNLSLIVEPLPGFGNCYYSLAYYQ